MKKAEEELHFVSLKVPTSMLRRINEVRAQFEAQDPIKSWSRSEVMRLVLEKSLSASFVTTLLNTALEPEDDETKDREEEGKTEGGGP